jgi:putative sterol carrier protein
MPKFLEEQWVATFNRITATLMPANDGPPARSWTIQYILTRDNDGPLSYFMLMTSGGLSIDLGETENPDLTVREEYETATRIARGEITAIDALAAGLIQVRGELGALAEHAMILTKAATRLDELNSQTTY